MIYSASATLAPMATIFRTFKLWLVVSFLLIGGGTDRLAVLEFSGDGAPTTYSTVAISVPTK